MTHSSQTTRVARVGFLAARVGFDAAENEFCEVCPLCTASRGRGLEGPRAGLVVAHRLLREAQRTVRAVLDDLSVSE